jgi:hypothetical protein
MVTRKKTARRRRTITRRGRKRSVRRLGRRRSVRRVGGAKQQVGQGPNLGRLLRADVLTARGARSMDATMLNRIEQLSTRVIDALIEARKRVGRRPNCWLI